MKKFQTAEPVDETAEGTVRQGLTRRQIATGAVWAVPVITLAVATPAAAASTVEDYTIVFSVGTRTVGHVGGVPILASVPFSFTITNNTGAAIPVGTPIRIRVADDTVTNPLPGLQIAAISGAAYAAPVGTYPAKTITFSLGLAIAAGSSQTFALSVLLGAGTVDDGTVLSWDTSVKILGSYQVGSEKTSDLSWVGTSA